jgi:hypothetical protein
VGPAEYVNVPVGPERTLACLELAVLLGVSDGGRAAPATPPGRAWLESSGGLTSYSGE